MPDSETNHFQQSPWQVRDKSATNPFVLL